MKAMTLLLAMFLGFQAKAGTKVDLKEFLASVEGAYEIDMAGGHVPSAQNNQAEVFADADEGILTLPFCGSNGLCDPGYVELAYPTTTAEREELSPGHFIVEINTTFGAKKYRYTWESEGTKVTFTNYQYLLGTQVTQLQHVLHKVGN